MIGRKNQIFGVPAIRAYACFFVGMMAIYVMLLPQSEEQVVPAV
jgi:hypothetical protein